MMRRLDGARDALRDRGESCKLTVQQGFSTFDSGVRAAKELLSLEPRPTAIFAANDDMAAGVIRSTGPAPARGLEGPPA